MMRNSDFLQQFSCLSMCLPFKISNTRKFCLMAFVSKIVSLPPGSSSRVYLRSAHSTQCDFCNLARRRGRVERLRGTAGSDYDELLRC